MAPSKSIVGGNFQDALGNAITGNLLLVLPQDALITGTGQLAPINVRIPVNGGSIASTPIWFNDQLSPGNTAYTATVYDSTGNKVYGPEIWSLAGASPLSLSTLVPALISPDPLFSNPVLQNPAQAQTITGFGLTLTSSAPITIQGNLTSSGGGTLSGGFTGTFAALTVPPNTAVSTTNAVTLSISNPAAIRTYTVPDFGSNDSFVGLAATQTLTNKTLTSASSGNTTILLNAQANAAAIVGTGAAATVYTYTLPANTVASLKGIRVSVGLNHSTGTALVAYVLSLNGQTAISQSSTVTGQAAMSATIVNTGSTTGTSSTPAILYGGGSGTASTLTGLAWASNQVLTLTFNVAATDQVTPIQWIVELIQ